MAENVGDIYDEALAKQSERRSASLKSGQEEYDRQLKAADNAYEALKREAQVNLKLQGRAAQINDAAAGITDRAGARTITQRGDNNLRNTLGKTQRQHENFEKNVELALKKLEIQNAADDAFYAAQTEAQKKSAELSQGNFEKELGLDKQQLELSRQQSDFDKAYKLFSKRYIDNIGFEGMTGIKVKALPKVKKNIVVKDAITTSSAAANDPDYVAKETYFYGEQIVYYVRKDVYENTQRAGISLTEGGLPKTNMQLMKDYYGLNDDGHFDYDTLMNNLTSSTSSAEKMFGTQNYEIMRAYSTEKADSFKYSDSSLEPIFEELDDLVLDPDRNKARLGADKYLEKLDEIFNTAGTQINNIIKAKNEISLSDNNLSYNYVKENYPYLKLEYTDSLEDRIRKKNGIVPASFDASQIEYKPAITTSDSYESDPDYVAQDVNQYGETVICYVRKDILDKTLRLKIPLFENGLPRSEQQLLLDIYGMDDDGHVSFETLQTNMENNRDYVQRAFGLENYVDMKRLADMELWYSDYDATGKCPSIEALKSEVLKPIQDSEKIEQLSAAAWEEVGSLSAILTDIYQSGNTITCEQLEALEPGITSNFEYSDSDYDDVLKSLGLPPMIIGPEILDGVILPEGYVEPEIWNAQASAEAIKLWAGNKLMDDTIALAYALPETEESAALTSAANALGDTYESKQMRAQAAQLKIDNNKAIIDTEAQAIKEQGGEDITEDDAWEIAAQMNFIDQNAISPEDAADNVDGIEVTVKFSRLADDVKVTTWNPDTLLLDTWLEFPVTGYRYEEEQLVDINNAISYLMWEQCNGFEMNAELAEELEKKGLGEIVEKIRGKKEGDKYVLTDGARNMLRDSLIATRKEENNSLEATPEEKEILVNSAWPDLQAELEKAKQQPQSEKNDKWISDLNLYKYYELNGIKVTGDYETDRAAAKAELLNTLKSLGIDELNDMDNLGELTAAVIHKTRSLSFGNFDEEYRQQWINALHYIDAAPPELFMMTEAEYEDYLHSSRTALGEGFMTNLFFGVNRFVDEHAVDPEDIKYPVFEYGEYTPTPTVYKNGRFVVPSGNKLQEELEKNNPFAYAAGGFVGDLTGGIVSDGIGKSLSGTASKLFGKVKGLFGTKALTLGDDLARGLSYADEALKGLSLTDDAARSLNLTDDAARGLNLTDDAARKLNLTDDAARGLSSADDVLKASADDVLKGADDVLKGSADDVLKGADDVLRGSADDVLKGADDVLKGSADDVLKGADDVLRGSADDVLKGADDVLKGSADDVLKGADDVLRGSADDVLKGADDAFLNRLKSPEELNAIKAADAFKDVDALKRLDLKYADDLKNAAGKVPEELHNAIGDTYLKLNDIPENAVSKEAFEPLESAYRKYERLGTPESAKNFLQEAEKIQAGIGEKFGWKAGQTAAPSGGIPPEGGTSAGNAVLDKGDTIRPLNDGKKITLGNGDAARVETDNIDIELMSGDNQNRNVELSGGAYRDVPANGGQVHHMPADSVSPYSKNDGPAIRMETKDHMDTASWGSSKKAKSYRAKQGELIKEGKFLEALQMDIDDINKKFGNKYDDAIRLMMEYANKLLG